MIRRLPSWVRRAAVLCAAARTAKVATLRTYCRNLRALPWIGTSTVVRHTSSRQRKTTDSITGHSTSAERFQHAHQSVARTPHNALISRRPAAPGLHASLREPSAPSTSPAMPWRPAAARSPRRREQCCCTALPPPCGGRALPKTTQPKASLDGVATLATTLATPASARAGTSGPRAYLTFLPSTAPPEAASLPLL